MKTIACLGVLLALLVAAGQQKLEVQNLATNGGFETGDFSGWSQNNSPRGEVGLVNGHNPHSGSYGAELDEFYLGPGSSTQNTIYQTLATQPGTSYLISFWLNGNTNYYFFSECFSYWNNTLVSHTFDVLTGWTNVQAVVTATTSSTVLQFNFNCEFGYGPTFITFFDDVSVTALPSSNNQLSCQRLSNGDVRFTYVGLTGTNYALDRTFSLSAPNWVAQAMNTAPVGGVLMFTNTPNTATNNFWRVRSVP